MPSALLNNHERDITRKNTMAYARFRVAVFFSHADNTLRFFFFRRHAYFFFLHYYDDIMRYLPLRLRRQRLATLFINRQTH